VKSSVVKDNVLRLVQDYPEIKDNYNTLVATYWREIDGIESLDNDEVIEGTSPETITRCFRKLVEEKKIKLNPYSIEVRLDKEYQYKKEFGK